MFPGKHWTDHPLIGALVFSAIAGAYAFAVAAGAHGVSPYMPLQ